jgi:hypothetical protein
MNNPRRIQRHLVKALAAGAVLVAAALPLAIAGVAGAATDAISAVSFTPSGGADFGTGASGNVTLTGTFAGNGGTATITTNAPGVTFTSVVDTSLTSVTAAYASTSATVPGTYNLTFTDTQGTVIDSNAFTVNQAPSVSAITPTTAPDTSSPTATPVTITGANFVTATGPVYPTVSLTNTTNGTTIAAADVVVSGATSTTITATITPLTLVGGTPEPATPGTYTITVTNPDGGTSTSAGLFTVTGNEITVISPSALPFEASSTTATLTVDGGGFQSGATIALAGTCTQITAVGAATVTSATTLTVPVTYTDAATPVRCNFTVTNTGGNDASFTTTAGALGIGEASDVAPVITASSLTAGTAIEPGSGPQAITFTGEGFSQFTTPGITTTGSPAVTDTSASLGTSCLGGTTGTTLSCEITVAGGAATGPHTAALVNDAASGSLADAFSVAGPVITSAAPTAVAVGAPVGTTVVLTGTGFTNTSTGSVTAAGGTGLAGTLTYVSPTTEDFVVTSPPTAPGTATLGLTTVDSDGASEVSAPFSLTVDAAPSVTSITYAGTTTGVGIGAAAQTITINGSGFETGATIGSFVNAAGTADADVTGKVTAVNAAGTVVTATIAVATGDTNAIDGFTVTNPDGGSAKAFAVAPAGLVIDAAPTITAVSPVTATPAATNAFTITGTGFQAGATVVLSSDGTCGTATVASATSITASCTIGEPGTAAVTLSVVNPDGGTATSGTILAAKAAGTTSTFHVTGAHGTAIAGKTVTMTISGTGFYGQPKITSTAAGTKVGVSKDSGKVLTIRVTTKAGISGEHTFTIKLANGKSAKANYDIKK